MAFYLISHIFTKNRDRVQYTGSLFGSSVVIYGSYDVQKNDISCKIEAKKIFITVQTLILISFLYFPFFLFYMGKQR